MTSKREEATSANVEETDANDLLAKRLDDVLESRYEFIESAECQASTSQSSTSDRVCSGIKLFRDSTIRLKNDTQTEDTSAKTRSAKTKRNRSSTDRSSNSSDDSDNDNERAKLRAAAVSADWVMAAADKDTKTKRSLDKEDCDTVNTKKHKVS